MYSFGKTINACIYKDSYDSQQHVAFLQEQEMEENRVAALETYIFF